MRIFQCHCGNRVFFDNTHCLNCERELGFDPALLDMVALDRVALDTVALDRVAQDLGADGRLATPEGAGYRRCGNFHRYRNCNWLLRADDARELCFSCRMNEVIPALDKPGNLKLWARAEEAKRRLLYSLLSCRLPLTGRHAPGFRFLEDQRTNPDVFESYVLTGRLGNTITINIAEADDAARHAAREQMHERYRTVLGHLRHESAHVYFGLLTEGPADLQECRSLFGDERDNYPAALQTYYDNGPPQDWHRHFVSAYASAHPAEDFAETFAHFLHITDALESARAGNLATDPAPDRADDWISAWVDVSITLNEISRSLGSDDPYPFLLPEPVKQKLKFIDRLVRRQAERKGG